MTTAGTLQLAPGGRAGAVTDPVVPCGHPSVPYGWAPDDISTIPLWTLASARVHRAPSPRTLLLRPGRHRLTEPLPRLAPACAASSGWLCATVSSVHLRGAKCVFIPGLSLPCPPQPHQGLLTSSAMRTRSSASHSARSPAPVQAAASSGRRVRRDTPVAPPARGGTRSRGFILSPLAEGRGRGSLGTPRIPTHTTSNAHLRAPALHPSFSSRVLPSAQPVPRAGGASFAGRAEIGGAGVTAPATGALGLLVVSALAPRPASEGPFASSAPVSAEGPGAPKIEPRDVSVALDRTAPEAPVPPATTSVLTDASGGVLEPEQLERVDAVEPAATRGTTAAPGDDSASQDEREKTRSPLPPPPYDLPPSSPPSDDDEDDAPAATAVGARESLSPDFVLPDDHQGASPARPSPDADDACTSAAIADDANAGPAHEDAASEDGDDERVLSPSPVLSYYDPGDEPDLPPRRNAPTEPRARVFATDVEALLDEIHRVPSARTGQGAGPAARITPRPDGGFPEAHIAHPRVIFLNIKDSQRRDWSAHQGPKAFVQFGGHGALDDLFNANLGLITNATAELHAFLGTSTACIAIPLASDIPNAPNQAPFFALIHDISEGELERILEQRVIATPRVAMLISEYGVPMPVLIGVLTGFRSSNEDEIYLLVRDRMEDLIPFIMTKAYENPEIAGAITLKAFADRILASVRVKHLPMRGEGGRADPHFYIYASLPLTHFPSFREVQLRLAQADWGHSFAGSGRFTILEDPFCSFCHGADHPRGLCPFPAVPGWIAPSDPPPPRAPANNKRRAGESAGGERCKLARNY
ncbi:hypothetical protein EIP86_001890 [Pleurotus ostreatoroseus]|nr:hypothetical protein EIP86_001890 [Pleurotus ostreatoroseus]